MSRNHITCCIKCTPPKRQVGCHGKCPEYIKEKQEYEEHKAKVNSAKKIDIEMEEYMHEQNIHFEHKMHIKNRNRR